MHNQVEVAMCPSRHMNMGTLYAEVLQLPWSYCGDNNIGFLIFHCRWLPPIYFCQIWAFCVVRITYDKLNKWPIKLLDRYSFMINFQLNSFKKLVRWVMKVVDRN